jgi:hypothetical protein
MIYDDDQDKIQLNICLPRHYRGMLRKIAAEKIIENPDTVESAASVGAEIIRKYLDEQERRASKGKKEE